MIKIILLTLIAFLPFAECCAFSAIAKDEPIKAPTVNQYAELANIVMEWPSNKDKIDSSMHLVIEHLHNESKDLTFEEICAMLKKMFDKKEMCWIALFITYPVVAVISCLLGMGFAFGLQAFFDG